MEPAERRGADGAGRLRAPEPGPAARVRRNTGELANDPNAFDALRRRARSGKLTWRGPALMLFARSLFGADPKETVPDA
jgi:hypothetical protein